jgi:glycosyltransferase involved in cell wall biosynthesis
MGGTNALLVTLKKSPAFLMTIKDKVQSYMTAGKPILTMLSGEGSRVVENACCGFVADAGDYEQLIDNIEQMIRLSCEDLNVLANNAKAYAHNEFDRDKLISQLEGWFVDLSAQRKGGQA